MEEVDEEEVEGGEASMLGLLWPLRAACRPWPNEWWFPEAVNDEYVEPNAKDVCDGCMVREECFEWALYHELHGTWAGTSPAARARLRKTLGIKVSSPGLVIRKVSIEQENDDDDEYGESASAD